jgi:hypothetical protein
MPDSQHGQSESVLYPTVVKPTSELRPGDQLRVPKLGTVEVLRDPVLDGWGYSIEVIPRPVGSPTTIWLDHGDDWKVVEAGADPLPTTKKCPTCGGIGIRGAHNYLCMNCMGAGIVPRRVAS